jgi:hypothetical protein
MTNFTELSSVSADPPVPVADQLRLAVAAYLTRFKGSSRDHSESDLRCFLAWCAERGLGPLAARRPHLELYIRLLRPPARLVRLLSLIKWGSRLSISAGSPCRSVRPKSLRR